SEAESDAALARIRAGGVRHYATLRRERPGEINQRYGGRGVYFDDPNGHLMELITQPYGETPQQGRFVRRRSVSATSSRRGLAARARGRRGRSRSQTGRALRWPRPAGASFRRDGGHRAATR